MQELDFDIRVCKSCELVYVSPQPIEDELPRFYDEFYADMSKRDIEARSLGLTEAHLRKIVMERCPDGGRYLEVGCGPGRLMRTIADLPWEFEAFELNEKAAEYARRDVPQAAIHNTSITEIDFEPESRDLVTIIGVLEHMKDPMATLTKMTKWLAPGGVILIQVPYIQHVMRIKKWFAPWAPVHFEAPRHLFDFSPKTLAHYLRKLGYTDIHVEVARPCMSRGPIGTAMIWALKAAGIALYRLSGRRYVYPLACAIVVHARKAT
jgi:2-polyprenyl-3-methyl-5-hydroxy-6-metoxy-1,4-benzoquinol methylase